MVACNSRSVIDALHGNHQYMLLFQTVGGRRVHPTVQCVVAEAREPRRIICQQGGRPLPPSSNLPHPSPFASLSLPFYHNTSSDAVQQLDGKPRAGCPRYRARPLLPKALRHRICGNIKGEAQQ